MKYVFRFCKNQDYRHFDLENTPSLFPLLIDDSCKTRCDIYFILKSETLSTIHTDQHEFEIGILPGKIPFPTFLRLYYSRILFHVFTISHVLLFCVTQK